MDQDGSEEDILQRIETSKEDSKGDLGRQDK